MISPPLRQVVGYVRKFDILECGHKVRHHRKIATHRRCIECLDEDVRAGILQATRWEPSTGRKPGPRPSTPARTG